MDTCTYTRTHIRTHTHTHTRTHPRTPASFQLYCSRNPPGSSRVVGLLNVPPVDTSRGDCLLVTVLLLLSDFQTEKKRKRSVCNNTLCTTNLLLSTAGSERYSGTPHGTVHDTSHELKRWCFSVDMFPHGVRLECTSHHHLFRSFSSSSFSLLNSRSFFTLSVHRFVGLPIFLFSWTGNSYAFL